MFNTLKESLIWIFIKFSVYFILFYSLQDERMSVLLDAMNSRYREA